MLTSTATLHIQHKPVNTLCVNSTAYYKIRHCKFKAKKAEGSMGLTETPSPL